MTKYKDKRWYVLFVKSDGRTVPIRHFKGMVGAIIFFGAALVALIGVLVFLYMSLVDEKATLERMVISQEKQKTAIKKEKDSLMAQLAIAESKLKISMTDDKETRPATQADHAEKPIEIVASVSYTHLTLPTTGSLG